MGGCFSFERFAGVNERRVGVSRSCVTKFLLTKTCELRAARGRVARTAKGEVRAGALIARVRSNSFRS
jgi:hypothetical protein